MMERQWNECSWCGGQLPIEMQLDYDFKPLVAEDSTVSTLLQLE